MKPGEVWQVEYPQLGGREQAGERPALVLQDDGFALRCPTVLTIPFTTSAGATRYPAVLPVPADPASGLTRDSYLLVFQVQATDRRRVGRKLGQVSLTTLADVHAALDRLTGRTRAPGAP